MDKTDKMEKRVPRLSKITQAYYCKAAYNFFRGQTYDIHNQLIENAPDGIFADFLHELPTDVKVSLVLNSTTELRLYTDKTVKIGGETLTAKPSTYGNYYVIASNIRAQNLGKWITVKIDGEDYYVNPILTYGYRTMQSAAATDAQKDVCRALYLYFRHAENYSLYEDCE